MTSGARPSAATSRVPVTARGRTALVQPVPAALVAAAFMVLSALAMLAWDYALLPAEPLNELLYWGALALGFVGIAAIGGLGRSSARRQLAALALLGLLTWLPYYLRSPARLVFVDELFHRDILARILETGHARDLPVTLFPLPGTFPGLESATVGLMAWTGLGMDDGIRLMTLLVHIAIPLVVYTAMRPLGLSRRAAFLAAIVYSANTSYFFFHSVFSYETLGILLFLAAWTLVTSGVGRRTRTSTARRAPGTQRAVILLALPVLTGIAVTHHLSSYVLIVGLVVAWLVLRRRNPDAARIAGAVALVALLVAVVWLTVAADRVIPYLRAAVVARIGGIIDTLTAGTGPRQLFANSDQPVIERLVAFSYPVLVLALGAVGLWLAWRRRGPRPSLWLPLALLGPVLWLPTTGAVLTHSGELAYRSWPFLFLGVALFAALALARIAGWGNARVAGSGTTCALALAGLLLVGGASIGGNQAGRFPTSSPANAAGGATNTPDVLDAARWLLATAGPGHLVATDVGTAVVFGTEGRQRIVAWQSWYPFVVGDPAKVATYVQSAGTEYLVVDERITRLPPRYDSYFGAPAIPGSLDPGRPFPASLLATLDRTPGLDRVYEGDHITIYRVADPAPGNAG